MEKEIKDVLFGVVPKNNPKKEINHVYIDSEFMVATDTAVLITYKHGLEVSSPALLINAGAKPENMFNPSGFIDGMPVCSSGFKFPDYTRVIPSTDKRNFKKRLAGLEALYAMQYEYGFVLDFVKRAPLFKKLDKITFEWATFTDKNTPMSLGNDVLTVVIMPYIHEGAF